jgi:hypothetical protein
MWRLWLAIGTVLVLVGEPADDAQQPAMTQRTVGPPTVVNPFGATAAPNVVQDETVAPFSRQGDQQRLPPGPPSRFP